MLPSGNGKPRTVASSRVARALRHLRSWSLAHPLIGAALASLVLSVLYLVVGMQLESPRAVAIADAIFGGFIASLATTAIVQMIYLQRTANAVRRWLRLAHRDVWILPTTLEHPSEGRYSPRPYFVVPPFDAHASGILTQILRHAHYRYPQRKTLGSHVWDPNILRDNLVLLCLPTRNQYSRVFLGLFHELYVRKRSMSDLAADAVEQFRADSSCQLEYFGLRATPREGWSEWQIRDFTDAITPNRWRTSTINDEGVVNAHIPGKVAVDYAMILRAPNPFNTDASVLIVCGIHGIGTFGASLYLFQHANHMLTNHGDEPQVHLLQVEYVIPSNRENYLEAEIRPPIYRQSTMYLDKIK